MSLFDLKTADSPLVISVPHDGALIPESIKAKLYPQFWDTPDRDQGICEVFEFEDLVYSKISANYSRYVVDLNRPANRQTLYPGQQETAICPIRTFKDETIYLPNEEPNTVEIEQRIKIYWQPYHDQLRYLIDKAIARHGWCLLIDAHSIDAELPMLFEGRLPDISIGTFNGASCDTQYVSLIEHALISQKEYSHVTNGRFKGGFITRHYGQPKTHCHAIQLEHVKDIYQGSDQQQLTQFWQDVFLSFKSFSQTN